MEQWHNQKIDRLCVTVLLTANTSKLPVKGTGNVYAFIVNGATVCVHVFVCLDVVVIANNYHACLSIRHLHAEEHAHTHTHSTQKLVGTACVSVCVCVFK